MRLKLFIVVLFFLSYILFPFTAFAQSSMAPSVTLPKSQTVNENYFGTGQEVDVEGTINGDAYLAGRTILVNGTVNGDILAAGGQITIRGNVHNIRVVGGQILIDGKVNGNVTVAGGSVTFSSGSSVTGSVVGVGGQLLLNGPIGKTMTIGAGQVTIGNAVGGNVSTATQQLTLASSAKVNGNLWYQSQQNAQIDKGAVISGKVTHAFPPQQKQQTNTTVAFFAGFALVASLVKFVIALLIGALLLSLVPVYSKRAIEGIGAHPWLYLGIGILAWILTPIIVLILLVTIFGIPFAFIFIFALIIFSYIGKIYAEVFIGNWVMHYISHQKQTNQYIALIIGIIIFEIVSWIPILGWLFVAIVSTMGFGSVVTLEKSYYTELRAKKII